MIIYIDMYIYISIYIYVKPPELCYVVGFSCQPKGTGNPLHWASRCRVLKEPSLKFEKGAFGLGALRRFMLQRGVILNGINTMSHPHMILVVRMVNICKTVVNTTFSPFSEGRPKIQKEKKIAETDMCWVLF